MTTLSGRKGVARSHDATRDAELISTPGPCGGKAPKPVFRGLDPNPSGPAKCLSRAGYVLVPTRPRCPSVLDIDRHRVLSRGTQLALTVILVGNIDPLFALSGWFIDGRCKFAPESWACSGSTIHR